MSNSTTIKRAHARAESDLSLRAFADRITSDSAFAQNVAKQNRLEHHELVYLVDAWYANKAKLKKDRRTATGGRVHTIRALRSNQHSTRGAYVPRPGDDFNGARKAVR